jgi:CubicO group peptidase (beta-lactamase class C family)
MDSATELPLDLTAFAEGCAARLDQILVDDAATSAFSGVVQIAWHGHPLLTRAVGLAHHDFAIPNTPTTKFNMGSLGKMITAVAVAQLTERNLLAFHDPIAAYLPSDIGAVPASITIHHLLTHTAGLADVFTAPYFATPKNQFRTDRALLQLLPSFTSHHAPGTAWSYSNAGYLLLGCLIEQITNQSYRQYIHESIFALAGMHDTSFTDLDDPLPNRAVGYTRRGADGQMVAEPWRANFYLVPTAGGAAGGGYTTVADMTRFAMAVQHGILLQPPTWSLVSSKHVQVSTASWYGYGLDIDESSGTRILGHDGGVPGFDARLEVYVGTGVTVVVLANHDRPAAQHVADRLRAYLSTATGSFSSDSVDEAA